MCASVCPSQALAFVTREEMALLRPNARPVDTFRFGGQTIRTKVNMMVPREAPEEVIDVTAAMHQPTLTNELLDTVFAEGVLGGDVFGEIRLGENVLGEGPA
jgi:hypothetical protein